MPDNYRFGYMDDEADADLNDDEYTAPSTEKILDPEPEKTVQEPESKPNKEKPHVEVVGEGISYRTREVAEELGISEQEVRNYSQYFSEFLDIDKTASGHRRFSRDNIEKLASILQLKRNNGYTIEQTKAALATEEGEIMVAKDEPERLKKLMEWTLGQMQDIVKAEVSTALKEQSEALNLLGTNAEQARLEQKEEDQKVISELQEQVETSTEAIKRMSDKMDQLIKEKDAKIQELMAQNEELQKKKRGFFFRR